MIPFIIVISQKCNFLYCIIITRYLLKPYHNVSQKNSDSKTATLNLCPIARNIRLNENKKGLIASCYN